MRTLNYMQAIAEALTLEMRRDPNIYIAGEDVGKFGGSFGVTGPVYKEFGPGRVLDTPISETAIIGHAVGAAAAGLRPVVEILFMDFLPIASDELCNQAAKIRYMFGGQVTCPHGGPDRHRGRHRRGRSPFPEPGGLGMPHPGPQDHRSRHPGRCQGPAHLGHPRRQPGGLPRAQDAVRL